MEAALQFAFNWRATSGVKASEIKEYTGKVGGMILSASEKKAQAGLILDVIASHLSRDQQALLDASYGGENGERHAGIERLTHLCAHQNRTLARMLMMREFVHGERYCPSAPSIKRPYRASHPRSPRPSQSCASRPSRSCDRHSSGAAGSTDRRKHERLD
jgi:hypothetical protein